MNSRGRSARSPPETRERNRAQATERRHNRQPDVSPLRGCALWGRASGDFAAPPSPAIHRSSLRGCALWGRGLQPRSGVL